MACGKKNGWFAQGNVRTGQDQECGCDACMGWQLQATERGSNRRGLAKARAGNPAVQRGHGQASTPPMEALLSILHGSPMSVDAQKVLMRSTSRNGVRPHYAGPVNGWNSQMAFANGGGGPRGGGIGMTIKKFNITWVPSPAPAPGVLPHVDGDTKVSLEFNGKSLEVEVDMRLDCAGLPPHHPQCQGLIAHEMYHALAYPLCVLACLNLGGVFEKCDAKCKHWTVDVPGGFGEFMGTLVQVIAVATTPVH